MEHPPLLSRLILSSTLAFGFLSLVAPLEADARASVTKWATATVYCQPSTPLNLGGLRFRPLGIYNASANPIYISCSLVADPRADQHTDTSVGFTGPWLQIFFKSSASTTVTVDCTIVGGYRDNSAVSLPVSISVSPGDLTGVYRSGLDKVNQFGNINISCLLPPKLEMVHLGYGEYSRNDLL